MDNLSARGQQGQQNNFGLPSLDLTAMQNVAVPTDWEIDQPWGDIIMAEVVDENEHGEVLRNGIWLKQEVTQKMWRVAKVLKTGPRVEMIKEGDYVMYPSDKGLPLTKVAGKKLIFLNEERIFAKVKKPDNA